MLAADQFCPVLKLLYPDERDPFQYMTVPPLHVTRAQWKFEYEVNVNNVLWPPRSLDDNDIERL